MMVTTHQITEVNKILVEKIKRLAVTNALLGKKTKEKHKTPPLVHKSKN